MYAGKSLVAVLVERIRHLRRLAMACETLAPVLAKTGSSVPDSSEQVPPMLEEVGASSLTSPILRNIANELS